MGNEDPGIQFFPEIGAGGFSRIDSTIQFYERINALLDAAVRLLHANGVALGYDLPAAIGAELFVYTPGAHLAAATGIAVNSPSLR